MDYEKNNYKKFKNLKYGDNKLIGNHGMWAEANKNQTISFKIMKIIKKINEQITLLLEEPRIFQRV